MIGKYPFLKEAKEKVKQREIDEKVLEMGYLRMMELGKGKRKIILDEEDEIKEVLAYLGERVLLTYIKNNFLINKYAILESKRAYSYLQEEDEENIKKIEEDLGINVDGNYIDIVDFIKYAPKDKYYRLIKREFKKGKIKINKHEEKRIIAEAIKIKFLKIPKINMEKNKTLEKYKELLISSLPKPKIPKINTNSIAPCMRAIIDMLKKHENVGHTGRWLLAVYLINKGMETEKIIKIFSNAPDFDEKITRYQIEHAKKKKYMMPNCSLVMSYGYCIKDCGIKNPLNWRERNDKRYKNN